jgi:hypothetical protein
MFFRKESIKLDLIKESRMPHPPHVSLGIEPLEDRCVPSTSSYVSVLYANLLHRFPGPVESAGVVFQLDAGTPPAVVSLGITHSPEYQRNLVRLEFQAYLHRNPTAAEVNFWTGQLQAGLGEQSFESMLLGSPEYILLHGANSVSWLNGVYEDVLARLPDPAGQSNWLSLLGRGVGNQGVALGIVNSSEAHGRVVAALFQQLLNRSPDPAGFTALVNQLNQGVMPSDVAALIAASPEFIARAGGLSFPTIPTAMTPLTFTPPASFTTPFTTIVAPALTMQGLGTPFIPPLGGINVFPAPALNVLPFSLFPM